MFQKLMIIIHEHKNVQVGFELLIIIKMKRENGGEEQEEEEDV